MSDSDSGNIDRIVLPWYPPGVIDLLGAGTTCFVGLLDDGNVLKYRKVQDEPCPELEVEAEIYKSLGHHPFILSYLGRTVHGLKFRQCRRLQDHLVTADESRRVRWSLQCAEAVAHIHSVHVLHCDLHPNNILLDENDNIQVSDFQGKYGDLDAGAREAVRYSLPGADQPSIKTDLFALGSTIYWMMTGKHPYEERSAAEVEDSFVKQDFPVVTCVLAPLIVGCWRGDYQRAEAVVRAIQKTVVYPKLCSTSMSEH